MNALFDSAGLAIVAYAEVVGSSGAAPNINSGFVTTTRTGAGQYSLTLPGNTTGAQASQQMAGTDDLIFVTPKVPSGTPLGSTPFTAMVDDNDPLVKKVAIYGGSPLATFADMDFSVLVLRCIVPKPSQPNLGPA